MHVAPIYRFEVSILEDVNVESLGSTSYDIIRLNDKVTCLILDATCHHVGVASAFGKEFIKDT